jgi:hypothetical protein
MGLLLMEDKSHLIIEISVNPLQNRETQHVNIVLQCMYRFFEQPNRKGKPAHQDLSNIEGTFQFLQNFQL